MEEELAWETSGTEQLEPVMLDERGVVELWSAFLYNLLCDALKES